MCTYCFKMIHYKVFHDYRKCPERVMLLQHEQLLELSLRLNWSRRTRKLLRITFGPTCATEHAFNAAREELRSTLPPARLCADRISVTSDPSANLRFMLAAPHMVMPFVFVFVLFCFL